VFRRIERLFDGDASARRRLAEAPRTPALVARQLAKHLFYLISAAMVAHLFMAYFISLPKLYRYMGESPLAHVKVFAVVVGLTTVLYLTFSRFREQFCIILCPYGRIQSALTDEDTMVIGYDPKRGEPRGRSTDAGAGDCVNCRRCVQVCPTGIDIRSGLQLECIGCAACIDACDEIMDKLERPRGLVRYDSQNGLAGKTTRMVRPRTVFYSGLMLLGAMALTFSLTRIHDVEASLTRLRGMPYFVTEDSVRNQFQVRLFTKRNVPTTFALRLEGQPPGFRPSGFEVPIIVPAQGQVIHPFIISADRSTYEGKVEFDLVIASTPGDTELRRRIRFVGPDARLLAEDQKRISQPASL
ncbi:MAG: 4Fe-4S dicluster domain-containing protein, partial [Verrucomicrobiota bacterium]